MDEKIIDSQLAEINEKINKLLLCNTDNAVTEAIKLIVELDNFKKDLGKEKNCNK